MSHLLLFGGTFDPIHHGHLITARAAREILRCDHILLIPAHISPHKQEDAPAATPQQRLEMLHLAIAGQSDFAIDAREILRPGPSYTFDTIMQLRQERPHDSFTFLLGVDQLPKFHMWYKIKELLAMPGLNFALLGRPGHDPTEGFVTVERSLGPAIAQRLRDSLLATARIDISSTVVRRRISGNLPITYLVPESVAAYIATQHLYRHVPE